MIEAVFGGIALGASLAALADAFRSPEAPQGQDTLGQFVFSAGPPSGGPSGGGGPMVLPPGPEGGGDQATGPVLSVEPTTAGWGGSPFFGINAPFYFWPYAFPLYSVQPRPIRLECRTEEIDDEDVLVCRKTYPLRPVAWGPVAGFF
jgi:hypothetical protein